MLGYCNLGNSVSHISHVSINTNAVDEKGRKPWKWDEAGLEENGDSRTAESDGKTEWKGNDKRESEWERDPKRREKGHMKIHIKKEVKNKANNKASRQWTSEFRDFVFCALLLLYFLLPDLWNVHERTLLIIFHFLFVVSKQKCSPFTVFVLPKSNCLFIRSCDWHGYDHHPLWWAFRMKDKMFRVCITASKHLENFMKLAFSWLRLQSILNNRRNFQRIEKIYRPKGAQENKKTVPFFWNRCTFLKK